MTDNAISPLRRRAGGCHLDRKIDELIRLAGFDLPNLHFEYAPGPTPCPICTKDARAGVIGIHRVAGLAALAATSQESDNSLLWALYSA